MSKLKKKYKEILELIDLKLGEYEGQNIESIPIRFLRADLEFYDLDEEKFKNILHKLKEGGYIKKIVKPSENDFMDVGYGEQPIGTLDYDNFPGVFWINISKDFTKLYKRELEESKSIEKNISLKENKVIFNDKKAKITMDEKECQLPVFTNEHLFCRSMFKRGINELVGWDAVYEEVSGDLEDSSKKEKKSTQDTMYRVNKRVREDFSTKDSLFTMEKHNIKRNY